MVFIQILLGGITRLTGSGLSITRWEIVTGTIPPLNQVDWNEAFDLYKATPQYQKINEGMSLDRFKFIFFWEYFHRVWARLMGFVFLIPFIIFLVRKSLSQKLIKRLIVVIAIAAAAAVFGWIMVASGLIHRPWVNAYKLTIHLSLGIALILALFYTYIKERNQDSLFISIRERNWINWIYAIGILQVLLGGTLSGMKAALLYPTWPKMNNEWIPSFILSPRNWNLENFLFYDESGFMPALIQVAHRLNGYIFLLVVAIFAIMTVQTHKLRINVFYLLGIIVVQVLLGIGTLINSTGQIPLFYGVAHQAFAIFTIGFIFYLVISTQKSVIKS